MQTTLELKELFCNTRKQLIIVCERLEFHIKLANGSATNFKIHLVSLINGLPTQMVSVATRLCEIMLYTYVHVEHCYIFFILN